MGAIPHEFIERLEKVGRDVPCIHCDYLIVGIS